MRRPASRSRFHLSRLLLAALGASSALSLSTLANPLPAAANTVINGCTIVHVPSPSHRTECPRANLAGQQLFDRNLNYAYLPGADLSHANLSRTGLTGASLVYGNLSGANLVRTSLYGASLGLANLEGANLTRADLIRADLGDTNLTRADLDGANLSNADLSGAQTSGANFQRVSWRHTKCPDGTNSNADPHDTCVGHLEVARTP